MASYQHIQLATKPTAQISYGFHEPVSTPSTVLVVFLNGMGLPQASWAASITQLQEIRQSSTIPALLTYDRFGQGESTDRDPQDKGSSDPTHGHDCLNVVKDLRQLITQVASEKLGVADVDSLSLVLVGNSIGCPLARLYAHEYPQTVAALLLLDSNIANTDFVSVFPDPDAEGFNPDTLPPDVTPDHLRATRTSVGKIFHPDVGSNEGLSRKNLPTLLPASDGPILKGPNDHGPFVTVVGHDFETFAEEATKIGWPKPVTMAYLNPFWHKYNEGLIKITEGARSKGPLQAPGSGHFIQKDNPAFVAQELDELLSKVLQ
ncbi:hypothetical protein N7474_000543 [Penicillium riverlandense]|uniref:uncharacterized protein n=1 Tax=Penicillium riverlandense TaxID=1903569 RepID=UPI002547ED99|nr:uncharacterized protein N7474_000543 [Penicillium riverlandense]KAJ5832232.1 hypothetical protein N7474_000543 [Penicillium riverlandense]